MSVALLLRESAPAVRAKPVAEFCVKAIVLPPCESVRPASVCASVAADLPFNVNVPPPSVSEPVLAKTFVAFVVKSTVKPPAFTVVPPV